MPASCTPRHSDPTCTHDCVQSNNTVDANIAIRANTICWMVSYQEVGHCFGLLLKCQDCQHSIWTLCICGHLLCMRWHAPGCPASSHLNVYTISSRYARKERGGNMRVQSNSWWATGSHSCLNAEYSSTLLLQSWRQLIN